MNVPNMSLFINMDYKRISNKNHIFICFMCLRTNRILYLILHIKNVLQNNVPLTTKRINGNTELSSSPTRLFLGSKWEKASTEDPPTHQWVFPLTTDPQPSEPSGNLYGQPCVYDVSY